MITDTYGFEFLEKIKKETEVLLIKNQIPDNWTSDKKNLIEIKNKCELIIKIVEL